MGTIEHAIAIIIDARPAGTRGIRAWIICGLLSILILALDGSRPTVAVEKLWFELCSSCHLDDTPTCIGCHNHRGELDASTTRRDYFPGEEVQVVFRGGEEYGWTRATLYDDSGIELDRASGPTGSGNDAREAASADSVTFPLTLIGSAPSIPGSYEWRAAYFGIFQIHNVTHDEEWIPVTITVMDPDSIPTGQSWGRIKDLYR